MHRTNDIERALVGSATSSGKGVTWWFPLLSVFGFLSFLDLDEKNRGPKQDVGAIEMQDGCWMQAGCCEQETEFFDNPSEPRLVDLTMERLTVHLRERSKSESITCPSSLTRTFSGFRSR